MKPVQLWFALATFWCSALIFWLEPLIGKQLLPLVGGAPAVWNVCLLFFQLALLIGYATAHGLTRVRSPHAQAGIYLMIAAAGMLLLPARFDSAPADASRPAVWLLQQLTGELLLPFVTLAAAAPLLQHWYSRTTSASARDPYFLYAASNAGSLLALLAFPVLIEPALRIQTQNTIWAVLFGAGVLLAAAASSRSRLRPHASAATPHAARPAARQLLHWAVLAAVPSSMLLGVTTYVTSDIAPVPLLWVVPLAIYLATFIAAFGWLRGGLPWWFARIVVMLAVVWCLLYRLQATDPLPLLITIHLLVFAALALGVHVRLAQRRPDASQLTLYYLAVAAGGALGGAFNALAAPALFDSFAEYPIAVLAAVWLNLRRKNERPDLLEDFAPLLLIAAVVVVTLTLPLHPQLADVLPAAALPVALAYVLSRRPLRFTLALALILVSARFDRTLYGRVLHAERNFYGLLRVTTDDDGRFHELRHGNTVHGAIDMQRAGGSEPLSYYWLGSPVAEVIRDAQQRHDSLQVAAVGLGVGALAWYARSGEAWTYYEINPAVITLARDTTLFHFLARSRAGSMRIVTGDARLQLRAAPAASYDIIILDAFTSDAIPLHLLTREAVALYGARLRPDGILVFHVSNRYLRLHEPIAATGHANGFRTFVREQNVSAQQLAERIESSDWLVLARDSAAFSLIAGGNWREVRRDGQRVWTDDYSNLWSAFLR